MNLLKVGSRIDLTIWFTRVYDHNSRKVAKSGTNF